MEIANSFDICIAISQELQKDKAFSALAQDVYGKAWSIEIGFDGLRQDWKKVAPFVILLPQTVDGTDDGTITYGTGLLLGVVDRKMSETTVRHMQGIAFLSEDAVPALLHAVGKAVDGISGLQFSQYECEYDYESFPLIYCNMGLTFTQHLAIGGRRR